MSVTLTVVVGAGVGAIYDRWARRSADPEAAERMGVLAATGMIVGESLWGVAFAGIVYATGSDAPLALVGADWEIPGAVGGTMLFCALVGILYSRAVRANRR
jgi:hypothetical protein